MASDSDVYHTVHTSFNSRQRNHGVRLIYPTSTVVELQDGQDDRLRGARGLFCASRVFEYGRVVGKELRNGRASRLST